MSASRSRSSSAQDVIYTDPSGDNSGNSPDITDVTVSTNDATTAYTFRLNMPNYSGLASDTFVDIYIDSDRDGKANYLIRLYGSGNRIEINSWNGSAWSPFVAALLQGTYSFPEVIDVGRSDLGGTGAFWFWTRAWKYISGSSPPCCYDNAPDAGVWAYQLSTGSTTTTTGGGTTTGPSGTTTTTGTTTARRPPPPPRPGAAPAGPPPPGVPKNGGNAGPVPTAPSNPSNPSGTAPSAKPAGSAPKSRVKLVAASLTLSPKRLRAGLFTAKLRIIRDDTGAQIPDGLVSCKAVVSKKRLHPIVHRFVRQAATCKWKVRGTRRGETLAGEVRVVYGGSTIRKTFRAVSR